MEQSLIDETIQILGRTPSAVDALLRGLPDSLTQANEGENTWSAFDIVGHLIHCERTDWMPRTRMILESGESKTFEPFDRFGHVEESRGKTLPELLDKFARVRAENISDLRAMNLNSEDLQRLGRHPAFGPVTLSQLLATWAAHDFNHLHQMSRVLAYQYRDSVGPWRIYLGVMK